MDYFATLSHVSDNVSIRDDYQNTSLKDTSTGTYVLAVQNVRVAKSGKSIVLESSTTRFGRDKVTSGGRAGYLARANLAPLPKHGTWATSLLAINSYHAGMRTKP